MPGGQEALLIKVFIYDKKTGHRLFKVYAWGVEYEYPETAIIKTTRGEELRADLRTETVICYYLLILFPEFYHFSGV